MAWNPNAYQYSQNGWGMQSWGQPMQNSMMQNGNQNWPMQNSDMSTQWNPNSMPMQNGWRMKRQSGWGQPMQNPMMQNGNQNWPMQDSDMNTQWNPNSQPMQHGWWMKMQNNWGQPMQDSGMNTQCDQNEVYMSCKKMERNCTTSSSGMMMVMNGDMDMDCMPGCQCKQGYVRDTMGSKMCIMQQKCSRN